MSSFSQAPTPAENSVQQMPASESSPSAPELQKTNVGDVVTQPPKRSPSSFVCKFFLAGTCRHGDECRFSHDSSQLAMQGGPQQSGRSMYPQQTGLAPTGNKPPPFLVVHTPPGHPVFSIDVECVATAVQHNARSIAQVALGKANFKSFYFNHVFIVDNRQISYGYSIIATIEHMASFDRHL